MMEELKQKMYNELVAGTMTGTSYSVREMAKKLRTRQVWILDWAREHPDIQTLTYIVVGNRKIRIKKIGDIRLRLQHAH